jgi:hypothetical protein
VRNVFSRVNRSGCPILRLFSGEGWDRTNVNRPQSPIYNASGTELAETWVNPTDPAWGGYTWASIPELTIDPGTYAVAVYVNGNTMFWSYELPPTVPGVTWVNEY